MGTMYSIAHIPTFEEACKITRFPFIPDGKELAYAEAFLIPHMSPQEYKRIVKERKKRLRNVPYDPYHYIDTFSLIEATYDNKITDEETLEILRR